MADRRSAGWARVSAAVVLLSSLGRAAGAQAPPVATGAASVTPSTLPASGRQVATLQIPRFGRYAIQTESAQGTSLALIDRVAGELGHGGVAGKEDARLDLLLDRGEYRLIAESDPHGGGQVKLAVVPSVERNPEPAPRLLEEKLVADTLRDHEQRSYWLQIDARRPVFLEAAGRHLEDLRLWRDGRWLEDAAAQCTIVQPVAGQPRRDCTLYATLEPGVVEVVAYGGRGLAWAAGDESPFLLRWGVPRLGDAGRGRFTASPFGIDRFLLPTSVNFVRLELPPSRTATLRVGAWRPGEAPFGVPTAVQSVTKESRPPVAEIRLTDDNDLTQAPEVASDETGDDGDQETVAPAEDEGDQEAQASDDGEAAASDEPESASDESSEAASAPSAEQAAAASGERAAWRWVEVTVPPGESYVLQQFELRDVYSFQRSGTFWLATVSAGAAADDLDASALLSTPRTVKGRPREQLVAAAALPLGRGRPWARRFNLLGTEELIVEVQDAGRYAVTASGAAALFTLQPYVTGPAPGSATPKPRRSGETWDLEPGLYRLTIEPRAKGIAEVALHEASTTAPAPGAARPSARFGPVQLDGSLSYLLRPAARPGVATGVVLRPWPLDLTVALPLALAPGEEISLTTDVKEAGTLTALDEQGQAVPVSVDGGEAIASPVLAAGSHRLTLRGSGDATRLLTLTLEPQRLAATAPLEPLPATAAFPRFPDLRPGEPVFLDLPASGRATYLVTADEPGAYRLESTGLLATEGVLRTRTVTAVERGAQNGSGRNFLLQPYLGAGDYQLTVGALGKTQGHLGLHLERTPVVDGGDLALGRAARATLAAGQALLYRFHVAEPGAYRLLALAQGSTFAVRVEDGEGWPIQKPGVKGDLTVDLPAGDFRLMLLPRAASGPALARVDRVATAQRGKGHGPEALPLGRRLEHLWEEPAAGAARVPDVWTFELPAPVHATIALDNEMQGHLLAASGGTPILVPPGRGFAGELAAGSYRLEVECSRRNNLVPYSIELQTAELVAGTARQVTAPAELPVAVGRDGLVEIDSFAPAAVRAELLDGERRVVARSEERPDDWNFLLAQRLGAGAYRLRVEPLGTRSVAATVTMRAPAEESLAASPPPLALKLPASDAVRLLPIGLQGAALLVAQASSRENVSLGVEVERGGGWSTLAQSTGREPRVVVAAAAGEALRLRLASLDHRGLPVELRVTSPSPRRLREAALAKGVELAADRDGVGAYALDLDRPGVFTARRAPAGLLATGAAGEPLRPLGREPLPAGSRLWLVATAPGIAELHRAPAAAPGEPPLRLRLEPGTHATVDLAPGAGPVVVQVAAPTGQPAVSLGDRAAVAAVGGAALAIGGPQSAAAEVRNGGAASGAAIDVDVVAKRFAPPLAAALSGGRAEGVLAAGTAAAVTLPAGAQRLRLRLGAGCAAALVEGGRVTRSLWNGGEPFEATLTATGEALWLLNPAGPGAPGAATEPWAVEALPATAEPRLAAGQPIERRYAAAGVEWIAVDAPAGALLHLRGEGFESTLVGDGGCIARGRDVATCGAGVLALAHGIGEAVAWIDRPGTELDAWAPAGGWTPLPATPPAALELSGEGVRLEAAVADGLVLHLRAAAPALALVVRRGQTTPHLLASGGQLDLLPDGGRVEIYLRGLFGQPLAGRVELVTTPVESLGEGLAAAVLLGPGERRFFRVEVAAPRRVGFGVQSASPAVEAELFGGGGESLGKGVVQMHDLAAGTYLLALSLPAQATAAAARPAVVGIAPRDTGPPEDVIREYLKQASEGQQP